MAVAVAVAAAAAVPQEQKCATEPGSIEVHVQINVRQGCK